MDDRYAVGRYLNMPPTGEGITVGVPTNNPGGLHTRNRLQGGRNKYAAVEKIGYGRGGGVVHSGRGTVEGPTHSEVHGMGRRRLGIKVRAVEGKQKPGDAQVDE